MAGETVAVRQRYFEEAGGYCLTVCFRKSAGTARSRRCNLRKRGLGARAPNKQNGRFPLSRKSPVFCICVYKCPACKIGNEVWKSMLILFAIPTIIDTRHPLRGGQTWTTFPSNNSLRDGVFPHAGFRFFAVTVVFLA